MFIEEYHDLLEKFGIEFDEQSVFKPVKYVEE